jgi:flagellar basal-body rod protein FlgC
MIHFIPSLPSTSAALDAERTRLDVIAQNIANSNTTHGVDGKPYQRQQVVFQAALEKAQNASGTLSNLQKPQVTHIQKDTRPGRSILQPGHPDADSNGMVVLPNVDLFEEMADLVAASRTYEANVAVLKNGKAMAMQALSIGKH